MRSVLSTTTFLSLASLALGANYTLVQDYSGSGFFSGWDFYGHYDNLTNGLYSPSCSYFCSGAHNHMVQATPHMSTRLIRPALRTSTLMDAPS